MSLLDKKLANIIEKYLHNLNKISTNYQKYLIPYFIEALNDSNPTVRALAVEGIEYIDNIIKNKKLN